VSQDSTVRWFLDRKIMRIKCWPQNIDNTVCFQHMQLTLYTLANLSNVAVPNSLLVSRLKTQASKCQSIFTQLHTTLHNCLDALASASTDFIQLTLFTISRRRPHIASRTPITTRRQLHWCVHRFTLRTCTSLSSTFSGSISVYSSRSLHRLLDRNL